MTGRFSIKRAAWFALAGLFAAAATPATGQVLTEQGLLCRAAIRQAETSSAVPQYLLGGIARVESGRRDPVTHAMHPWPWTINAEGKGNFFATKTEAILFARQLQARGVQSFDAGCLQVNLKHHPDAFASLEEAFDPVANARYAVKFLTQLREKTGSWETASAWYHSANPDYGLPYRDMVVAAMAEESKLGATYASLPVLAAGAVVPAAAVVSATRSLPTGPGTVIMLAGSRSGAIIMNQQAPGGLAQGGGGMIQPGRGLDSYRSQPVAQIGVRLAMK